MQRQSLQELGLDGLYEANKPDIVHDRTRADQGFVAGVRARKADGEAR